MLSFFNSLCLLSRKALSIIRKILVDKYMLVFKRRESIAWKYVRGCHVFKLGSRFVQKRFYWLTNLTITDLEVFLLSLCNISISSGLISTFIASPIRITTSSVELLAPSGTPKISNEFLP